MKNVKLNSSYVRFAALLPATDWMREPFASDTMTEMVASVSWTHERNGKKIDLINFAGR